MKVTYFASSTILVEASGISILMDPWLEDGEYYGSWAHFPPIDLDYKRFDDLDYIYISHIHPDHLSKKTLARLPKSVPVLIHCYDSKFLKRNIELAGFQVIELDHGARTPLGNDVYINILAADDCDPELCGAYFKCAPLLNRSGSTQVDSLCVIDHDGVVVVNTNDCPFGLSHPVLPKIKSQYGTIDLLLTGYAGAGPYPQCFSNLTHEEKEAAAQAKRQQFLQQGLNYIKALEPRYILPFAGQYTLAGALTELNSLRGVADLTEAKAFFAARAGDVDTSVVLLNRGGSVDLSNGVIEKPYSPPTQAETLEYCATVLAPRPFDFDDDESPDESALIALAISAAERAESKRQEMGVTSKTRVYVRLNEDTLALISMSGEKIQFVDAIVDDNTPYVSMTVQPKLLKRILSGPRYAHWNNATIGYSPKRVLH